MNDEKKHLEQVITIISNQICDYEFEINQQKTELKLSKDQITDNYYDLDQEEMARHKVDIDETEKNIFILKKKKINLEKQLNKPYFSRIDFSSNNNNQVIYIGIGSIINNGQNIVYDWRSPICSMYYDYDIGPASYECADGIIKGQITLKRQYNIIDQQLKFYIDTKETINDDILQMVLSQNTSSKMKEIVSTIQREQNKLIREDVDKSLIVQGVAGSGKTSIALHRAGYLLYKNKDFTNKDIFILSPSNIFNEYISSVLPELGEENVMETTFLTIAKSELDNKIQTRDIMIDILCQNKDNKILNEIAYKSSFGIIDDLLEFLKNSFSKTFKPQEMVFKNDKSDYCVTFTKEELEKLYYETYGNLDVYKRIDYMSEYLIERFNLKKKEFNPIKERFKKLLYKFFPTTDLQKILNLFNYLHNLSENNDGVYNYKDIPALLIIKDYMFGLNFSMPTKYLIIDEMQDFTPLHFYLFNKLWDCPKLLLGDINQCIEKKLNKDYLTHLSDFMNANVIEMNKTYRSTKQISEFSQKLIGLKNVVNMNRNGQVPEIICTDNIANDIVNLLLENSASYNTIAIICKTSQEVNKLYQKLKPIISLQKIQDKDSKIENKIIITTSTTSKGIEFDYVIIPYVDIENYKDSLDKNLLYVACTRALHKLTLIYDNKPSIFIK